MRTTYGCKKTGLGMKRTRINSIYAIHLAVVLATAWIAERADVTTWYVVLAIGFPLVLSFLPRTSSLSYTLNVRILFPISVGLFCVALFHYFPHLLETSNASGLASYLDKQGIESFGAAGESIDQALFQVNPIFKDSVTVLYAVCAAFLLWKGLSDFDELKHILYEEAGTIRSIADFTEYFMSGGAPEANYLAVHRLRSLLLEYVENILKDGRVVTAARNEEILEEGIAVVSDLKIGDKNDEFALEEVMKALTRVATLRSKRAVCIEKRMSPFILVIMFLMSTTMVLSFFGNATGELSIDYVYVFLLPTFYTSIFMTLLDLSSPFDGYWAIKLEAVDSVRKKLAKGTDARSDALISHAVA
ncbi:bestrophin-like domain [Roseovarius salinarum]|uniref:bestrophin-like domain n=1 Tax=Roseovarius salinarum TaxID=1981892 RepID=UPI000C343044|nr:DUF4239 domain-containing protein [Roseovarius salinarum]